MADALLGKLRNLSQWLDDEDDSSENHMALLGDLVTLLPEIVAALERDAQDAVRYRWLRGPDQESTRYSRWMIEHWAGANGWQPMQREQMDAAIDAAKERT